MATVTTKPMTATEFYDFVHRPENSDRVFELERGEIVELTRSGKRHGFVCANTTRVLVNFAQLRRKSYVCSNNVGMIVERDPDTVRGPDVMLFEDVASIDDLETKYGERPPRLAVEVVSPNDSPGKLNRKIREQIGFGVLLVWVVDSEMRCVTVYRPGQGRSIEQYTLEDTEELTGEDVLPDFRCQVADFFAFPGQ